MFLNGGHQNDGSVALSFLSLAIQPFEFVSDLNTGLAFGSG